jgi:glyoxylase-like metal-dependent hydrolase (beta-lactamase superfamily II)
MTQRRRGSVLTFGGRHSERLESLRSSFRKESTVNRFEIGGFQITRIEEIVDLVDANFLIPKLTSEILEENASWLAPHHYNVDTKQLTMFIQSWLIRSGRHTILVDACCGNNKSRPWYPNFHDLNTPYLNRLTEVGCTPEDVDFVLCTHLHPDHVGWNTRLQNGRWVPTFSKAKYLISKTECDPFASRNEAMPPPLCDVYEDSVLPVIAAGQVLQVEGFHEVSDSIVLEPAPGHTPGHYIVRLGNHGTIALFAGDVVHSPIQITYPEFNSAFCSDVATAVQTRRRILDDCADNGHLLVPGHFGPPHMGRVCHNDETYLFKPGL